MKIWLSDLNILNQEEGAYLEDLKNFSLARKGSLMNEDGYTDIFSKFDIVSISKSHFKLSPSEAVLSAPMLFRVQHNSDQKNSIQAYKKEFGMAHDGLGKMLMRYPHVHKLFRYPIEIQNAG